MSSEWPQVSLREFVDLLTGFAFKSSGYTENAGDIRLLRGDNIAPGKVRWNGVKRWPKHNDVDLSRYALESGDVVLAMDRPWIPAGLKVAQISETDTPSYLVQRVARLRTASQEDRRFLFALLSTPDFESYIQNVTTGTAVPHISSKQILDYTFNLPPVHVRTEVGALTAALDDRITLLRETNATLEAIAQALFKSWFVDFDPVRAKMEGRAPEGMDEATAALFPDALEESELGWVPKGWRNVSLKEAVSIHDSKRVPLSGQEREKRKGPYPYYGAAALMDTVDNYLFDGVYLLTGEDGSVADTNGYPIMQYVWGKFWVNNHAHILQGKDGAATEHVMQRTNITPYITGAVQAKLSQTNMWRINFLKPTREVSEHFAALIDPLFVRFRHNAEQAQTLATLRDTLLPRLISGQLRLPEAQTATEAALGAALQA